MAAKNLYERMVLNDEENQDRIGYGLYTAALMNCHTGRKTAAQFQADLKLTDTERNAFETDLAKFSAHANPHQLMLEVEAWFRDACNGCTGTVDYTSYTAFRSMLDGN